MFNEAAILAVFDGDNYRGPVAIRECSNKSHGRGLFLTRDVKAGELLFCEKAFAAVFEPSKESDHQKSRAGGTEEIDNSLSLDMVQCALWIMCHQKLEQDPSLLPAFTDLYAGSKAGVTSEESQNESKIDLPRVSYQVSWNTFSFPVASRSSHRPSTHARNGYVQTLWSIGIWLLASRLNHACVPNIRFSWAGDVMIARATADLPVGTELRHSYMEAGKTYDERQQFLEAYGFMCNCSLCEAWRNTSNKKKKKRVRLLETWHELVEQNNPLELQAYKEIIDQIEETYVHPATEEPRLELKIPLVRCIQGCSKQDWSWMVFTFVDRYLKNLGFDYAFSATTFEILKWGYVDDFLVVCLMALWKALRSCGTQICAKIEELVKKVYGILVGETTSFEANYGRARPIVTDDPSAPVAKGMAYILKEAGPYVLR